MRTTLQTTAAIVLAALCMLGAPVAADGDESSDEPGSCITLMLNHRPLPVLIDPDACISGYGLPP